MKTLKQISVLAGLGLIVGVAQASAQLDSATSSLDPTTSSHDINRDGRVDRFDIPTDRDTTTDRAPSSAPGISDNANINPGAGGFDTAPPTAADGANPVTGTSGGMSTGTGITTSPITPGSTGSPSTGSGAGGSGTSTGVGSMDGGR